ncbi:hypothetical protein PtA15_11A660 [Puccinia triticina]|uniref:Uncharacterized protein n=1 Tax=Puccinia triticina TaxID=208348 RepID=A0ABY7D047_9BASI|nr:uncharacterized protein PtA15_11A660 [Puccinia triticina]WAQ89968.1 hypothetical protein PtA15_11A660 [Puccinia triticina]WAR60006.1 hypothetical protein PtB15_11B647 [Puccinia triticina]
MAKVEIIEILGPDQRKKYLIKDNNTWAPFALAAEQAYPSKAVCINLSQVDPRVVAREESQNAEVNTRLIMQHSTDAERAPLEHQRAWLAANPNAQIAKPGTEKTPAWFLA